jgi:hypothetical protein
MAAEPVASTQPAGAGVVVTVEVDVGLPIGVAVVVAVEVEVDMPVDVLVAVGEPWAVIVFVTMGV